MYNSANSPMRNPYLFSPCLILSLLLCGLGCEAQSFNGDKVALTGFLSRMYKNAPFEGVKVVEDYNSKYLVSVVNLEKVKYPTVYMMNRVAQTKAQSLANTFLNGSVISSDLIIRTSETRSASGSTSTVETIEAIRDNAMGFVKGLELLTNFDTDEDKRMAFIYYRELNPSPASK
jgi:hypothetical protein